MGHLVGRYFTLLLCHNGYTCAIIIVTEMMRDKNGRNIPHLSDPQCKNAVSAFQISCKLISFTLEDS